MSFIGSNPDELDALASELDEASATLESAHARVMTRIVRSPWQGEDADDFRQQWTGPAKRVFARTATELTDTAKTLRRNADDQRRASDGAGGQLPPWLREKLDRFADKVGEAVERARLLRALEAARSMTPEEQLAWWNSLSPSEQAALIAMAPTSLLALTGLPADARAMAQQRAVDDLKKTLKTKSEKVSVHGEATIKIVKIQAGLEAEITTYADGHVEVALRAEAGVGLGADAGAASGSVMLNGEAELVYSFDSQAEADAFLHGLYEAPLPDNLGEYYMAGTAPAALVGSEIKEYLDGYRGSLEHTNLTGEIEGSVSLDVGAGGSVDLQGAAGVTYDATTRETSFYVEYSGGVEGGIGEFSGSMDGSAKVEVVMGDNGQVKELKFSGSYSGASGIDAGFASTEVGSGGNMTMTVDMTDPGNQQQAAALLRSVGNADAEGAQRALRGLYGGSQVVIQETVTTTTSTGVDVGVAEVDLTRESSSTIRSYVKPAHGGFTTVEHGGFNGSGGGSGW